MAFTIHIVDDRTKSLRRKSMVTMLADVWQKSGHVVTYGPIHSIDGDLAILHVDRTLVPQNLIPKNPSNKPFLNKSVLDISKSNFSTLRLNPYDKWNDSVIIKSNFNCFGNQEWNNRKKSLLDRLRRRLAKKFWRVARMLPPKQYPVLGSLGDVPNWVWSSSDLIVERFMPERDGDYYCLRGWVFFGDRGYVYRLFSSESVVKVGNIKKYEILDSPPKELVKFREDNNFDFGKFDYVEVEGTPILLDINKTPSLTADENSPRVKDLSEGLYSFLER